MFSLLAAPVRCSEGEFAYIVTNSTCYADPVYGVSLERTVTAVDLVLDYINSNSAFLPSINLTYGTGYTLEVSRTVQFNT